MGSLYHLAVDHVIENSSALQTDNQMQQLILIASEQLRKEEFRDARYSLWRLFTVVREPIVQISLLNTLGVVGSGDAKISRNIGDWVAGQNSLYLAGQNPDPRVVATAVSALGALKDEVAFQVIFSVKELQYSETVSVLALQSLLALNGSLQENLTKVIESGNVQEKLGALNLALSSDNLEETQKAEVAEKALEVGIYTTVAEPVDRKDLRDLRRTAMKALGDREWSKATPLAIGHFGMSLLDYDRGTVTKDYFLEAIEGLGGMGTHAAAERLTLFLELINSYTEHGRVYDEQVVLTVLSNLNKLGDKIAFANLSYTQYLNYSDTVKQAAENAIENLKW